MPASTSIRCLPPLTTGPSSNKSRSARTGNFWLRATLSLLTMYSMIKTKHLRYDVGLYGAARARRIPPYLGPVVASFAVGNSQQSCEISACKDTTGEEDCALGTFHLGSEGPLVALCRHLGQYPLSGLVRQRDTGSSGPARIRKFLLRAIFRDNHGLASTESSKHDAHTSSHGQDPGAPEAQRCWDAWDEMPPAHVHI